VLPELRRDRRGGLVPGLAVDARGGAQGGVGGVGDGDRATEDHDVLRLQVLDRLERHRRHAVLLGQQDRRVVAAGERATGQGVGEGVTHTSRDVDRVGGRRVVLPGQLRGGRVAVLALDPGHVVARGDELVLHGLADGDRATEDDDLARLQLLQGVDGRLRQRGGLGQQDRRGAGVPETLGRAEPAGDAGGGRQGVGEVTAGGDVDLLHRGDVLVGDRGRGGVAVVAVPPLDAVAAHGHGHVRTAVVGAGRDRRGPRGVVGHRGRAVGVTLVAGRRGDEDPGLRGEQEGDLVGRDDVLPRAGDRVVDDVDTVLDRLVDGGDEARAGAGPGPAGGHPQRLVHGDVRLRRHAAGLAQGDAVDLQRHAVVAGGGAGGVAAVAVHVPGRQVVVGRVVAELAAVEAGPDDLVVALEGAIVVGAEVAGAGE